MRNGIFREYEGYELVVDGVNRTFSDTRQGAFEMTRNLKRTNRDSICQKATFALQQICKFV